MDRLDAAIVRAFGDEQRHLEGKGLSVAAAFEHRAVIDGIEHLAFDGAFAFEHRAISTGSPGDRRRARQRLVYHGIDQRHQNRTINKAQILAVGTHGQPTSLGLADHPHPVAFVETTDFFTIGIGFAAHIQVLGYDVSTRKRRHGLPQKGLFRFVLSGGPEGSEDSQHPGNAQTKGTAIGSRRADLPPQNWND